MKKVNRQQQNFHNAVDNILRDGSTTGEISIAGFLSQHGLFDRSTSVGSIGSLTRLEAIALNALVPKEGTFVVLGCGSVASQRTYSAELTSEIEAHGYDVRAQFADLTLTGRWPQILTAMANTKVGIVGIDAQWASSESGFWITLQQFMKGGKSLVFIRHMLDFRNVQSLLPLIRSMPEHWEQNVIAATPNSIWFAPDAESAGNFRQTMRLSGLFPEATRKLGADQGDGPVFVSSEWALATVDRSGRFPRAVYVTNDENRSDIDYQSGWSHPEGDGCWTADNVSVMRLRLPETMSRTPTAISISGNSWVAPDKGEQIVEIGVGNEPTRWTETVFTASDEIKTTIVECATVKYDPSGLILRFRVRSPGRPIDYGELDNRLLGFKCRSLSVFT